MANVDPALSAVQRRDAQRLRAVFDQTGARTNAFINEPSEVFEQLGLSNDEGHTAFRWLCDEGLASFKGGLAITHAGIKEVENSIRNPEESTGHFSPIAINMVFHGAVGAVQNGARAVANVNQQTGVSSEPVIAMLIEALRDKLADVPAGERREAEAIVEDVRKEAAKKPPSKRRMHGYLTMLATIQALAMPASELMQHFLP